MTSMKRAVWPAVSACLLIGVLFLGVFPTRTYLSQRRDKQDLVAQVREIRSGNEKLDARVKQLQGDPEIERLARSQYNLVRPGEEAYALLPAPEPPKPPPPPKDEAKEKRSLLARAWDTITP